MELVHVWMRNKMSRNMGGYEKGLVGVVFLCALLVAT